MSNITYTNKPTQAVAYDANKWNSQDANEVKTVVNSKADVASPALTGVPTAPTAAADTNTTQLATTAFVIGQGYLKSATAAGLYAVINSPTFTGIPLAPTATLGTNTTQLATTAFLQQELAANAVYWDGNDIGGLGTSGSPLTVNVSNVLDKISSTRGTVLYRGAAGWAALAPGTEGYRLTSHGAGADPTWAAGSGSSTVDVLYSNSYTSVASISIDLSSYLSSYTKFEIIFEGTPATNATDLQAQISTDGTTFLTGGNYNYAWGWRTYNSSGNGGNVGLTQWTLFDGLSNTSGNHFSGTVIVINPNRASVKPQAKFFGSKNESSGAYVDITGSLWYSQNSVWGGIKFFMSSGNIASGYVKVIGYKN